MLIHKIRLSAMSLLLLAAVAAGAGSLSPLLAMKVKPLRDPNSQQPPKLAEPDRPEQAVIPGPGRMFVTGIVLDSTGKPAAGVPVDIIGRPRAPWVATREYVDPRVLIGSGETDALGRFRFDALRTTADGFFEVYALAVSARFWPGLGLAQPGCQAARG